MIMFAFFLFVSFDFSVACHFVMGPCFPVLSIQYKPHPFTPSQCLGRVWRAGSRLVQDAGDNVGGGFADTSVNLLDLLRGDVRDIGHQIRNLALGIRKLFVHIMFRQDVGDPQQHAGDVHVGVAQTDRVFLIPNRSQIHFGEVDGADGGTRVDKLDQRLRDLDTNHGLGFLGRATDMGGQQGVGATDQFRFKEGTVRSGFLGEDIHGGATQMTGTQGLGQGGNLDDGATGGVDQVRASLHFGELGFSNHVLGLLGLGDVEGDKVRDLEQFVQSVDLLAAAQGHQGDNIVEEDAHAHGLGQDRELRSNVTITDDSYRQKEEEG